MNNHRKQTHATDVDPLIGERPSWWWTGATPTEVTHLLNNCVTSLPQINMATCLRHEVQDYFANGWLLNEVLFSGLSGEASFMVNPYHNLRHPMIFYYGHTASLFVNKLLLAGLTKEKINARLENMFEVGVDEMSWDDMSKNDMIWPSVAEVTAYRRQVFDLVSTIIATHPGLADGHAPINSTHPLWALFMGFEHERIHLETSSALIRELPINLVQIPKYWPRPPIGDTTTPLQRHSLDLDFVDIPSGSVRLGKLDSDPLYGWDNEYGQEQESVDAFSVSKTLVNNSSFMRFVDDGGYRTEHYWTVEGWAWRKHRDTQHPTFWVRTHDNRQPYRLRTIFQEVSFQNDWPVCVNFHEALAYLSWKSEKDSQPYRLPDEAEHTYLRRDVASHLKSRMHSINPPAVVTQGSSSVNLVMGSENSVYTSSPGSFGVHDIEGNVWDWCATAFRPLNGFKVHPYYHDFSTPCFDGEHQMILGGSFISTGNEASASARFHFRRHFFQHAGFHVVKSNPDRNNFLVNGPIHGNKKYEKTSVLDQYLLFHYGEPKFALPSTLSLSGVGNFSEQCVAKLVELAKKYTTSFESALDIGCAVGAATFALSGSYRYVTGLDISEKFIEAAQHLNQGHTLDYKIKIEGDIFESAVARPPFKCSLSTVVFDRADACALPAELSGFDVVLAANILCRLPDPKAFLRRLGGEHGLVKRGGLVMFTAPFSWLEDFTSVQNWLGGYSTDGVVQWSAAGLQQLMGPEFSLVHQEDVPFVIREHRRKFEYVLSDMTVWRRNP